MSPDSSLALLTVCHSTTSVHTFRLRQLIEEAKKAEENDSAEPFPWPKSSECMIIDVSDSEDSDGEDEDEVDDSN